MELKHEKGTKEAIVGLKSLIRGQRMGINSAKTSKIPVSRTDRITKTLFYGNHGKSYTDLGIGGIKKALIDFAKQAKNKINGKKINIKKEEMKPQRNRRSWKFGKITAISVGGK